jgi:hypothetical protein
VNEPVFKPRSPFAPLMVGGSLFMTVRVGLVRFALSTPLVFLALTRNTTDVVPAGTLFDFKNSCKRKTPLRTLSWMFIVNRYPKVDEGL